MKTLEPLQRRSARAGFSLAELMVVIVIIGLLATMVVPNVLGRLASSKQGIARSEIASIMQGIQQYYIDHNTNKLPDSLEILLEPDDNGEPYLDNASLKDPWDNLYQYDAPSTPAYREVLVYSFGRDGVQGGEGEDADIYLQDDEE